MNDIKYNILKAKFLTLCHIHNILADIAHIIHNRADAVYKQILGENKDGK